MKNLLAVLVPVLVLSVGPAFAVDAALDAAADMFAEYAPDEPELSFDELIGEGVLTLEPDPDLIRQAAPDVYEAAQAELGDDFGAGDGASDAAAPDATPVAAPEPEAPAPDTPGPLREPTIPDGWQRLEKLGLSFAVPPEFQPVQDEDDMMMLINRPELKPPACAIRVEYSDHDFGDVASEDGVVILQDQPIGFDTVFSGGRMSGEDGGVTIDGIVMVSDQLMNEDEYLVFTVSCGDVPAEDSEALIAQVLPTLRLLEAPPEPEPEELPLGGMISGQVPDTWMVYASNASEWILIAPGMQAAVNFRIGYDARSALLDLAPDRRERAIANPFIERANMFGADGWRFTGEIPPDDPEHGYYNGGMVGPSSYFFTDRCTPDGEPLVVSFSGQQSWLDKNDDMDRFLDSVELNWPDGESPCENRVAADMAEAIGANAPSPAAGAETPVVAEPVTDTQATPQADPIASEAGSPVESDPARWMDYVTPVFGAAVSYPADIFVDATPLSNQEGMHFKTADGQAEFKIGGSVMASPKTADDLMREQLLNPLFENILAMNRLGDNGFRLEASDKGQKIIQIITVTNDTDMLGFISRASDAYADLLDTVAGTFHIVEPPTADPAPATGTADQAMELAFWDTIKESTDPADFEAYLVQFPNGVFVALAQNRLKRLVAGPVQDLVAPFGHPQGISGPNGAFDTSWGLLSLAADANGAVYGEYEGGQSHIVGRMEGQTLIGTWHEPASAQRCDDGTYRGQIRLDFVADFTGFAGAWSYCDGVPGTSSNVKGTLQPGTAGTVAVPDTAAVDPDPAQTVSADDHDWQTYHNDRYGVDIDYPADLFVAQPPPANNDGRRFEMPDGAGGFYVFSQYNALEHSLQELYDADRAQPGEQVVEQMLADDGFAIKGQRDTFEFLRMTLVSRDGLLSVFEIRMDRSKAGLFNALAPRMAESFSQGAAADANAGSVGGPNGVYTSDWGDISFATDDRGNVQADYENGQSHLGGSMQGNTFVGRWLEPSSGRKCADNTYWGRLELDFSVDFEAFDGRWGYCEDEPKRSWTGSWNGPAGAVQGMPHPIADPVRPPEPVANAVPTGLPPTPSVNSLMTPPRGDPLRQALMDAARPVIAADIGQTVLFIVKELRTDGQWAYLQATPAQPSGMPLDWSETNYAADWQADAMSDTVMVLLAYQNGAWLVVDYIVGPTDVYWYSWIERFGLPEALFYTG